MSDRGHDDPRDDPHPTEYFPPRPDPSGADAPSASDLPPIGADRDPEPTQILPPWNDEPEPTTVMPSAPAGGGGGPGDPYDPYDPYDDGEEPQPWYRQRGPLLALGAGLLALILAVVALLVLTGGDDGDSESSLPPPIGTTTTAPTVPPTTEAPTTPPTTPTASSATTTTTTTTLPPTTTSSTTTTSTTTTSTTTTTTSSTSTSTTTTTVAPTTLPPPPPDPESAWQVIERSPGLGQFEQAIEDTDLVDEFSASDLTVLAPTDAAFDALRQSVGGEELLNDAEQLRQVLRRHLVPEARDLDALFAEDELPTQGGEPLSVDQDARTIEGASVLQSVGAANDSILHSIDLVIV